MLIFDRFPNRVKAEAFAAQISKMFGHDASVYDSQEESNAVDPFPFVLTPPIVLVERKHDNQNETEIVEMVKTFSGKFAGT